MKMLFSKLFIVATSALIACAVSVTLISNNVSASSGSTCSSSGVRSYSGDVDVPVDVYDIYVKLGAIGQSAVVDIYSKSADTSSDCAHIGSIEASGGTWQKIGDYNEAGAGAVLELTSAALADTPDANRPTVMLVSRTNPACTPEKECITTVAGQSAFIRPKNVSTGSSLEIMHAQSLPATEIKEVKYYADNELLYKTVELEDFNLRTFPYYGSRMVRVIEYNSGQLAVIDQEAPSDREIDAWAVFFMPLYKYKNIFIILGVIIFLFALRGVINFYRRRQEWRLHHGFINQKASEVLFSKYPKIEAWVGFARRVFARASPFLIVSASVAVLGVGVSTYVFQLTKVDGDSMEMSFWSGQTVLMEKLPVTMAQLNQSSFTPSRGQVVIAYPNFGYGEEHEDASTVIKRVIGLPGDRIVIDKDSVTVFNFQNPQGFDPESGADWRTDIVKGNVVDSLDVTLNEDQLFVMGDNRPSSIDSRHSGPISTGQVAGVVREW